MYRDRVIATIDPRIAVPGGKPFGKFEPGIVGKRVVGSDGESTGSKLETGD